ncbi:MAG: GNAT family N-acetyltransferase [Chitinophagaceae bacterium]|nr:GNAT family N-acetyltransferase [Chitinophagaceae bacterium]
MALIFQSERLFVNPYTSYDADIFFQLNGDAQVMQYIREPKTRVESDAFLQENLHFYQKHPGLGRFALYIKTTNEFAGSFSLLSIDNSDDIHLGYALLKPFQGIGLATELVKASLPYVFRTIEKTKVHALTLEENIASQNVLHKCGFTFSHFTKQEGEEVMVFELSRTKAI